MAMNAAAAVHTHTQHEPDLFDVPTVTAAFRGRLIRDAEVRTKPVGDGQQSMPVLCVECAPLSGAGHMIHAEQVYTEATRGLAEQRARALRKGAVISIITPWTGMRLFMPHVQAINTEA